MRVRRVLGVLALAASQALAGCESGPEGPGTLTATVVAPQPLGAVVLEFTGGGIVGFSAEGDTRVFSAATPTNPSVHRVILVSPSGGREIRFGIEVSDRAGPPPAVAALSAAGPDNRSAPASGLQVRIDR